MLQFENDEIENEMGMLSFLKVNIRKLEVYKYQPIENEPLKMITIIILRLTTTNRVRQEIMLLGLVSLIWAFHPLCIQKEKKRSME